VARVGLCRDTDKSLPRKFGILLWTYSWVVAYFFFAVGGSSILVMQGSAFMLVSLTTSVVALFDHSL